MTASADSASGPRSPDNVLAAAAFVLGALIVFSTQDTLSKILVVDYSSIEIAWFRYTVNALLLVPFLVRSRGRVLVTRAPLLQLFRAIGILGSAVIFMVALGLLPIADATAINFVSPLLITALSIPMLGERVGIRRWIAVLVGFGGVLVIIRPGSDAFQWGALLPLLSASFWAIGIILTRKLSASDAPMTTLTYSTFIAAAALAAALPFFWKTPDAKALVLFLTMGVVSVAGQYFMTIGYGRAAASILAPLAYTQMIWSTTYGYFVFDAIPGLFTWIGGTIIVASGLYVLHRRQVRTHPDAQPS